MVSPGQNAPARKWRAFLLAGFVCLPVLAGAAPASKSTRPPPNFVQLRPPDQAEGARLLAEFRGLGPAGDYYLDFELQVRPRRGAGQVFSGQLWGTRNAFGPLSRVVLHDPATGPRRLLIQNGPSPAVWSWAADRDDPGPADSTRLFAPLLPGTDLTLFDLQMPYLYWPEFVFEGVTKLRGRPAHVFLLYPPEEVVALQPELHGVRVYLDTQFRALVQSELIGEDNRPLRTLSVLDLKKIDDQWMVKTIDVRDETTRNKTRFQVVRAAMGLDLAPQVFDFTALAEPIAPPERRVWLGR